MDKFRMIVEKNNSLVSVGLDIDKQRMPIFLFEEEKDPFFVFNKSIIDATKDSVCAYKINMAFYELYGTKGFDILERTIDYIPEEVLVIIDGKRNDIGNTAKMYAKGLFENLKADAVTINPYLGFDGVKPFLDYTNKYSFVLCRTSNKSAGDLQNIKSGNVPLYENVAKKIKGWNSNGNCGAVVGATYPEELRKIRTILGEDITLLIPGIGQQGGNIEKTVKYGTNKEKMMAIINSSRGIIFAGEDRDFADKARNTTILLKKSINRYR